MESTQNNFKEVQTQTLKERLFELETKDNKIKSLASQLVKCADEQRDWEFQRALNTLAIYINDLDY